MNVAFLLKKSISLSVVYNFVSFQNALEIANKNVIRIGRKEMLRDNDLHSDPVIDVVMKAKSESFKFIDLTVSPLRCKLISEVQIKTTLHFAKQHHEALRRAHFDASGSILAKTGNI